MEAALVAITTVRKICARVVSAYILQSLLAGNRRNRQGLASLATLTEVVVTILAICEPDDISMRRI
jgi:hypothetical protein